MSEITKKEFIDYLCSTLHTEKTSILMMGIIIHLNDLLLSKAPKIIAVIREEWSVDNDEAVYEEIKRILIK